MRDIEKYRRWNTLGIFPFPGETEEVFCSRAELLSKFQETDVIQQEHQSALEKVYALYGAFPAWVSVCYKSKGLSSWEGGCTWIEESSTASIQLSPKLKTVSFLSKCYHRDEVLAHEYVHAFRHGLHSTVFEEFFAYKASEYVGELLGKRKWLSSLQSRLASIFERPKEVYILLLLSFFPALVCMCGGEWIFFFLVSILCPLFFMLFLVIRNIIQRKVWERACLRFHLQTGKSPWPFLARLSDKEINELSKVANDIVQWAEHKARSAFRWEFLYTLYLSNHSKEVYCKKNFCGSI